MTCSLRLYREDEKAVPHTPRVFENGAETIGRNFSGIDAIRFPNRGEGYVEIIEIIDLR